jgi:hypothetical protein
MDSSLHRQVAWLATATTKLTSNLLLERTQLKLVQLDVAGLEQMQAFAWASTSPSMSVPLGEYSQKYLRA